MAELPPGDHRLRDIETLAALARAMDGLNANTLARLARHGIYFGSMPAAEVAIAATVAAEEIERELQPPRKGPRPKDSRAHTLRELAGIFTRATGQDAKIAVTSESARTKGGQPTGPFFRFVRAAWEPINEFDSVNDHALAKMIKRATTRTKGAK